jgi:oligopeptidase A
LPTWCWKIAWRTRRARPGILEDLKAKTDAYFQKENEELVAFAGQSQLEPWDIAYYAEKQRATLYDFDEEALRPYFPLESVVHGCSKSWSGCTVFGGGKAGRPGVGSVSEVLRNSRRESPREPPCWALFTPTGTRAKINAAGPGWIPSSPASRLERQSIRAARGLICGNLTPPVDNRPSLLTHREVQTIFHEFGHLLHHCLSQVEMRSLAGANVAWDFVELPSQIMENWCWERDALDLFARHYQTGQSIPEELFKKCGERAASGPPTRRCGSSA